MRTVTDFPSGAMGVIVRELLLWDERLLGYATGKMGGLLAATSSRAIIVKRGYATGQLFGRSVAAYPYEQITNVSLQMGWIEGCVTLGAAGVLVVPRSALAQAQAPNCVPFNRWPSLAAIQRVVDILRAETARAREPQQHHPSERVGG